MERPRSALKYFEENRDFMDTVVRAEIEKNRKGNASISLTDDQGRPVAGARIRVTQTEHEFKYGANLFMLDEFEDPEKNDIYREKFKEIFNLATIPFYWNDLEPEQGKPRFSEDSPRVYRRPAPDLCVRYCSENGIEPKCHCLNYDNFVPAWLRDAGVFHHKKMLEKRFRELADRYADVIPSWEVTNETFFPRQRYQTKFYQEDDFVEWSFRTADKYFPNNRLIINDYFVWEEAFVGNRSPYYMQIERLLRNGDIHLDSIGMQFHSFFPREQEEKMRETRYHPLFLYDVLNQYAKLGKRIQITEMTIPAYSPEPEDEEVQAELIRNLYTLFFSHPAMEAIIYWNLPDGYAAYAPQGDMSSGENAYYGGLLNYDLSEKKAYGVIRDLFGKKWRTETQCVTDMDGTAHFRGFYGAYTLEIMIGGKTVTRHMTLSSDRNNENILTV